jgi:tetratricopeptide (TPR) repeat protein
LLKVLHHKRIEKLFISSLVYKYLGYGYFKLGDYAKSIKSYQKIASVDQDESSKYNRLLAEGI